MLKILVIDSNPADLNAVHVAARRGTSHDEQRFEGRSLDLRNWLESLWPDRTSGGRQPSFLERVSPFAPLTDVFQAATAG